MSELPTRRQQLQFVRALPWLLGLLALVVVVGGALIVRNLLADTAPRLFVAGLNDAVVAEEWSVTISEVLRADSVEANGESLPAEAQWLLVYGEVRNFSGQDITLLPEQFVLEGAELPSVLTPDPEATRLAATSVLATDHIADGDGLLVPPAETTPIVLAYAVPEGVDDLALHVVPAQTVVELGALSQIAQLSPMPENSDAETGSTDDDGSTTVTEGTTDTTDNPLRVRARVLDVVDAETIRVEVEGKTEEVRYIGIVAPDDQPFARQAVAANQELVEGKEVMLERDLRDRDNDDRLLRYVWVGEEMVNGALVEQGLALVTTFPPNVKYRDELLKLEQEARAAKRGLWDENPGGIVAPRRTATARPRTATPRPATATAPRATSTERPAATATQAPAASATQPPAATTTRSLAATATRPPAATATQPPAASATQPPAATATQPPAATATQPPAATATQPPAPTATQPPAATATQPPTPTATQPPAPTATQPPAPTATQPPVPTATATPEASATQPPATAVPASPTATPGS